MIVYPIQFYPQLQEKIWGGNKLRTHLNKKTEADQIGESWEISGVPGAISLVANGQYQGTDLKTLIRTHKDELLGKRIYEEFGEDFPLLIKFIDAKQDLSVQLHPNDSLARERHNSFGKTEMWYVLQADKGAKLNIGFNRDISRESYLDHLNNGKITELLHFEEVNKGDAVFIHTGKVHAIGAGVLLAEIQQTSDITYRIYDWDRKDDQGNARELHTELAIDAIDLEKREDYQLNYEKLQNTSSPIASCKYFTTNFLPLKGSIEKDLSHLDSFVIYMCTEGEARLSAGVSEVVLSKGETILLPALTSQVKVSSASCELLEVYIS